MDGEGTVGADFIRQRIARDVEAGKHGGRVVTRFPPEPNGMLHIGHARPITLNFGIAAERADARCHLRFDDTNPVAEETEYVEAMKQDIRWLGYDWGEHLYFASDYFERIYEYALDLIRRGEAFVCDLTSEEIAAHRGTLTEPGRPSPYRDRSVEENLDLFQRMQVGEFEPGARVLRAKIDMASPVLPMRDPLLYRILRTPHHRTGKTWKVYPMYDFAHSLSDALEGITHSLCSLEFVDRRPLYDWILSQLEVPDPPQQIEFARLEISHMVTSKRKARRLIDEGHVSGWDDPRMSTLAAQRRRGVPPAAIRSFAEGIGLARREIRIELARYEFSIRDELNRVAERRMAVLRPLKLVIDDYPEDAEELLPAINNPEDASAGSREVPFSRELWIERDDFMLEPPKKFRRLTPGAEVRLRYAYLVTCTDVVRDDEGEVVEVHCTHDPATRGGDAPDGRKVRGTLHWVSARHARPAEVRLYETLFDVEDPDGGPEGSDFTENLNPHSLEVVSPCWVEPALEKVEVGTAVQFERLGYFAPDTDSRPDALVFNRTVTLRDSWAKQAKKG